MSLHAAKPYVLASLAAIACTWMISRAGPLDPPQGPVAPSMRTLDEIYDRIALGGGGMQVWTASIASTNSVGTGGVLVSGPGVLHAVYVPYLSSLCVFYDWADPKTPPPESARITTFFNTPNSPKTYEFDVRFTNGLYVTNPGDPGLTVMWGSK